MATLQTIRSKGPLLVIVIGIALFAFIAGDAWKIFQPHQGRQDVGEINGEKISAQDYQKLVDEYTEVIKLTNGLASLNENQLASVKDQVWQSYVNNMLIAEQAEKLGLTVTDAEIQSIIDEGTHPMLMNTPFRNPQTGAFDKDMLKKFLVDYSNLNSSQMPAQYVEYYQTMGNFWNFVEKTLRQSTLAEKYQNLISKSLISNPASAEDAFKARTEQSDLLMAAVPYSSVNDSLVKVSDDEIRNLYNERKEQYKQLAETRNIRYVDVQVLPSDADRKAVLDEVTEYCEQLDNTTSDYAAFIRSTGSNVAYSDIPVNKSVLPSDVVARLDSIGMNEVFGPYYNQADDSYNAFKILAKVNAPDSIQFRQIQVYAETEDKTKTLTDSIYNAINNGGNFEEIAKIYGQTGESTWVSSNTWEGNQINSENEEFIKALINQPVKEIAKLNIGQASVILQVMNKKSMQNKYKVAVIKRNVEFSNDTYNEAYNKFSQFVAQSNTIEELEKNAEEYGYTVIPRTDFSSAEHYVGGVPSTKEVIRWIFSAKEGDVSPLYECGNNDHIMVAALDRINPVGYRNINSVADMLRSEIRRNKKADLIIADMKSCTSIDQAKAVKNAVSDTIKHVTFSAPAYISLTRGSEPVISAVASKTAINATSAPVKGNAGVYMVQVLSKDNGKEELDVKSEETTLTNMYSRFATQFINDLYQKAKIVDNRYLYF